MKDYKCKICNLDVCPYAIQEQCAIKALVARVENMRKCYLELEKRLEVDPNLICCN